MDFIDIAPQMGSSLANAFLPVTADQRIFPAEYKSDFAEISPLAPDPHSGAM